MIVILASDAVAGSSLPELSVDIENQEEPIVKSEFSFTLPVADNCPDTSQGSPITEIDLELNTESVFQSAFLEPKIPLLSAAFTVASQVPFIYKNMELLQVFTAFLLATIALALWRRTKEFFSGYCGLALPFLPEWIHCLKSYRDAGVPIYIYPIQWFCFATVRNIKFCVTQGTLLWSLTFILCLPETQKTIKYKTAYTLLAQLIPAVLLTVAQIVELISYPFHDCLVALCDFLKSVATMVKQQWRKKRRVPMPVASTNCQLS